MDLTDQAYADLADADGFALVPHTYAPRTVGIDRVDHDIVDRLRAAWAPGVAETWPLRHPVDLITRDGAGARLCPEGAAEALTAAYGALDIEAAENGTYWLHPATRAALLSSRYPGRLLCLELRRDLVVQRWTPLQPLTVDPAAPAAWARPSAPASPACSPRVEPAQGSAGAAAARSRKAPGSTARPATRSPKWR